MLSQSNIDKLHMNGIYRCDPVLEWLPSYKRDNPYWCKNWTFKVKEYKGKYFMHDTYWSTGDDYRIELNDENFDKFEYLFDLDEVRLFSYENWLEFPYDSKWRVPLDSGGIFDQKYVVKRGVKKVKDRVIARLQDEIDSLKNKLECKERILERVINDEFDLDLY